MNSRLNVAVSTNYTKTGRTEPHCSKFPLIKTLYHIDWLIKNKIFNERLLSVIRQWDHILNVRPCCLINRHYNWSIFSNYVFQLPLQNHNSAYCIHTDGHIYQLNKKKNWCRDAVLGRQSPLSWSRLDRKFERLWNFLRIEFLTTMFLERVLCPWRGLVENYIELNIIF